MPVLVTAAEIRTASRKRVWIVVPRVVVGVVLSCAVMACVFHFGESIQRFTAQNIGEWAVPIVPVTAILPCLALMIVPLFFAEKRLAEAATKCPNCDEDISRCASQVLATRCCPACSQRVVEGGRIHSNDVYKRQKRMDSFRFLAYWLWAWPIAGLLVAAYLVFDGSMMDRCPHMLFFFGLIGTACGGWTWLRTKNRKYAPATLASSVVLLLGCISFAVWFAQVV